MSESKKEKKTASLLQNILKLGALIAKEEGLVDEEAINRVNEIKADAIKEAPETEIGKKVRDMALNDEIKSPYQKEVFDYNALRDTTTNKALRETLRELGKYEHLIINMKETDESRQKVEQDYEKLTLELFAILNKHKVGLGEYRYYFGALHAVIDAIQNYMTQQIEGHKTEILSRLIGQKNPGNEKFDSNHATYDGLLDSLAKVRKETGDKLEDYFNVERSDVKDTDKPTQEDN